MLLSEAFFDLPTKYSLFKGIPLFCDYADQVSVGGNFYGFSFGSCGSNTGYREKMIFRYNESSGITSLDPLKANNLANIWAVQQVFNGLVQLDANLNVEPCLAESFDVSGDGMMYTFRLRKDVFFHPDPCFNGNKRKLKASDVVFSLQRLVDENGPQWVLQQVADINGKKDILAIDEATVQIRLKRPYAQFLQVLTMPYCFVIPPEAVRYYGEDFGRHPVGTGPFLFRKWHDGEKLVLNKNEHYFEYDSDGYRLPYLDGIAITFVKDRQTAFLEFIAGRIDLISGLDPAYKDELLAPGGMLNPKYADRVYLQKTPYLNTEYLGINLESTESGPLGDIHVRQALSMALDRERLITYIRNGIGFPVREHFVPPVLLRVDQKGPGLTLQERRVQVDSLVKQSKYKQIQNIPLIILHTDVAYVDICTAILHQWGEFGFNVKLEVLDRPTLKSQVAKGQLDFFRASWIADYPEAENYLALFYSKNFSPAGPNYTHLEHPDMDEWYQQSLSQPDFDKRLTIYRRMDSLAIEQAAVIPLFVDEVTRFVRVEVKGLPPHPMNHLDLKRVKKTIPQK